MKKIIFLCVTLSSTSEPICVKKQRREMGIRRSEIGDRRMEDVEWMALIALKL
jgi:hypothetical protein